MNRPPVRNDLNPWVQLGLYATIITLLIWGWVALTRLAHMLEVPWALAWIPAVATSGVMLAATMLSLTPGLERRVRTYTGWLAFGGIAGDILATGTQHYLEARHLDPPAWLAVPVGGIPCLMGGLLVHAVAMVFAQRRREQAEAEAVARRADQERQARAEAEAEAAKTAAALASQRNADLAHERQLTVERAKQADEMRRRAEAERKLTEAVTVRAETAREALTATGRPHLVVDNTRKQRARSSSPVRDAALAWLRQQHAEGADLDAIGPKEISVAIGASYDTCKKGLANWRATISELVEAAG